MADSIGPSFGSELRRFRVVSGRPLRQVEVLGVASVPYAHGIERGSRNPPSTPKRREMADLAGQSGRAGCPTELTTLQRGSIFIAFKNVAQCKMSATLDRTIRSNRTASTKLVKICRILEE